MYDKMPKKPHESFKVILIIKVGKMWYLKDLSNANTKFTVVSSNNKFRCIP